MTQGKKYARSGTYGRENNDISSINQRFRRKILDEVHTNDAICILEYYLANILVYAVTIVVTVENEEKSFVIKIN